MSPLDLGAAMVLSEPITLMKVGGLAMVIGGIVLLGLGG